MNHHPAMSAAPSMTIPRSLIANLQLLFCDTLGHTAAPYAAAAATPSTATDTFDITPRPSATPRRIAIARVEPLCAMAAASTTAHDPKKAAAASLFTDDALCSTDGLKATNAIAPSAMAGRSENNVCPSRYAMSTVPRPNIVESHRARYTMSVAPEGYNGWDNGWMNGQ